MKINLEKFGNILVSRPSGHDAMLSIKAYFRPSSDQEKIELDFTGVQVVAPSWLDEVLTGLWEAYGKDRIVCMPSENPSVNESLKIIRSDESK